MLKPKAKPLKTFHLGSLGWAHRVAGERGQKKNRDAAYSCITDAIKQRGRFYIMSGYKKFADTNLTLIECFKSFLLKYKLVWNKHIYFEIFLTKEIIKIYGIL